LIFSDGYNGASAAEEDNYIGKLDNSQSYGRYLKLLGLYLNNNLGFKT